jgi:hypothetical protein
MRAAALGASSALALASRLNPVTVGVGEEDGTKPETRSTLRLRCAPAMLAPLPHSEGEELRGGMPPKPTRSIPEDADPGAVGGDTAGDAPRTTGEPRARNASAAPTLGDVPSIM